MNVLNTKAGAYAAVVVVGVVALYFVGKKLATVGTEAAAAVGRAVDPTSDQNIFYRGTNRVGEVLTGEAGFSLGSWLYDVFNPAPPPDAKAPAAGQGTPDNPIAPIDGWSRY